MNQQKSPLSSYDPSDYCTTREAAKILGTSLRTIQLWVESGILQAWTTPGGHRRVTRESVQQLLEGRTSTFSKIRQERLKVLVAEDDERSIGGLPLDLALVRNGFDALIKIVEAKPDVLITFALHSSLPLQIRDALEGWTASLYTAMLRDRLTYAGQNNIRARVPHSFIGSARRCGSSTLCDYQVSQALRMLGPTSLVSLFCSHNSFHLHRHSMHSGRNLHP